MFIDLCASKETIKQFDTSQIMNEFLTLNFKTSFQLGLYFRYKTLCGKWLPGCHKAGFHYSMTRILQLRMCLVSYPAISKIVMDHKIPREKEKKRIFVSVRRHWVTKGRVFHKEAVPSGVWCTLHVSRSPSLSGFPYTLGQDTPKLKIFQKVKIVNQTL